MKKIFKIVLIVFLVIIIGAVGFIGLFTGDAIYYAPCFSRKQESKIENKTVIFLGSSVTKGYGSFNVSFVNFLEKQYSVNAIKETVNGTTLINNGEKSYIARMEKLDKSIKADMFICQLSTNDATKNSPLGTVEESTDINSFDQSTVAGAIEYIICYAKSTWNCPVAFYTSFKYEDESYEKMYALLNQIASKWGITVIDFYGSSPDGGKYMADKIHPTMLGYRDLMTPIFARYIEKETTK